MEKEQLQSSVRYATKKHHEHTRDADDPLKVGFFADLVRKRGSSSPSRESSNDVDDRLGCHLSFES